MYLFLLPVVFFFFCWAYTETFITSDCKKKARLDLFLKPELFVLTLWKEALTFCWMIFSCFYFLLVFYFVGLFWNFDQVDHQAKSTVFSISLAWITCCYLIGAWKMRSKIRYLPGVRMLNKLPPKFKAIFFPFKEKQKLFGINKYHATTWRT